MDYVKMGRSIKKHRKIRRLTQEVLAERVGISAVFLSQIETANRCPSLETLVRIAEELDCSVDALIFGEAKHGGVFEMSAAGLTPEQTMIMALAFKKRTQREIAALIRAFSYLLEFE